MQLQCHDYLDGVIKKHELTRPDKEEDRMVHVRTNNANIEPVFFAYPAVKELDKIVAGLSKRRSRNMILWLKTASAIISGY